MEAKPDSMKYEGIGTGNSWAGVVPAGFLVGPNGCGPCVGLVLIPPKAGMRTFVLHFSASTNVSAAFEKVGFLQEEKVYVDKEFGPGKICFTFKIPLKGYKAVLNGAEYTKDETVNAQRLHTLQEVVKWLKREKIEIKGYVAAPSFGVDADGKVYWTTPKDSPVDDFEK